MTVYPFSYYYRLAAERLAASLRPNGDHRAICGILESIAPDCATRNRLFKLFSLYFCPEGSGKYDYWFGVTSCVHNPKILESYRQRITALLLMAEIAEDLEKEYYDKQPI